MQNSPSDQDLLQSFITKRNEGAFTKIAHRYSGLIYHCAHRILNDHSLAEDVTQKVLHALAKKAKHISRSQAPLPAWLHRATVMEAQTVRRTESRHHRKKEALMETKNNNPPALDPAWKDTLPYLDAAINKLSESDRNVIFLHYFSGLSFPEIAKKIGKSTAAVQKQSQRALAKLQQLFGKRGATLSLTAIGLGLSTEIAKAAPAHLVATLGSASSVSTTTTLLAANKTTLVAIGTTLIACGTPLALQQQEINRLESRKTSSTQLTSLTESNSSTSKSETSSTNSLFEELAKGINAGEYDVSLYLSAIDYINERSNDELLLLLPEVANSELSQKDQFAVAHQIVFRLTKNDPSLAFNAVFDVMPPEFCNEFIKRNNLLRIAIGDLAKQDPWQALDLFNSRLEDFALLALKESQRQMIEEEIREEIARNIFHLSPDQCAELLNTMSEIRKNSFFSNIVNGYGKQVRENPLSYLEVVRQLEGSLNPDDPLMRLGSCLVYHNHELEIAEKLFRQNELSPNESLMISRGIGARALYSSLTYSKKAKRRKEFKKKLIQFRTFLESHSPNEVDRHIGESLARVVQSWHSESSDVHEILLDYENLGLNESTLIGFLDTIGEHRTFSEERKQELYQLLSTQTD